MVWRSAEYLPQELVFNINYLGADQASFTLNFSKGASQVIGQYYQLIRLGKHGYRAIMSNLTRTADYLSDSLEALGFIIMSKKSGEGLPLVAFRLKPLEERNYDEFALARKLNPFFFHGLGCSQWLSRLCRVVDTQRFWMSADGGYSS